MLITSRRILLAVSFPLLLVALGCVQGCRLAPVEELDATSTERLTPDVLRGYGTVSGVFREAASGGSVLEITCEDANKAMLAQAKYLSDLTVLPGVTEKQESDPARTIYEVEGQGCIVAYCEGRQVTILAAKNEEQLASLTGQVNPSGVTIPQVEVPMYLDRWDKFGFRFYYWPWHLPAGTKRADYDFLHDFDYAQAQDRTGYVLWDAKNQMDFGEGLMKTSVWDWAAFAANARHLPIAINSSSGFDAEGPWLLNKYPEQVQQRMPDFCGCYRSVADVYPATQGALSWNAPEIFDDSLGLCQASLRPFVKMPSVVSFLEPHGELHHNDTDIMMEYGPLADAGYREYLKDKYHTPDALSRRWYGEPGKIAAWENVRVPELASFLGWNDQAIDLAGEWAVGYEVIPGKEDPTKVDLKALSDPGPIPAEPAPPEWFSAGFDDSAWPRVTAPGSDKAMFIPHRPAVYRRRFAMDEARLKAHARWWLYVWDCNETNHETVLAYLNGKKAGESPVNSRSVPHWDAYEVTGVLQSGSNQVSLRLPQGYLAYRVYLSPDAPKQYPQLGEGRNAQWVDLVEWTQATRIHQVERGMKMIRQIDPNRPITLMAPDHYADAVKNLAEDYGGEFHNTGYMGVFYGDILPCLMQGANLPFSIEPGGPAATLADFRNMMGLYLIENVQSVDYFIHEGDILWHDDIRKNFEDNSKLYHLFGKYHAPKGDVAVLYAIGAQSLTAFPWGNDPNTNLQAGYWDWNISSILRGYYCYDDLSESSFARGSADGYRVIIDSNNSIMDDKLESGIEQWVRNGGIFITSGQTGRHSPTKFNDWPISRLSGYKVARVDRHFPDGRVQETHKLAVAAGQAVFAGSEWNGVTANGLGLEKEAPDCKDLMLWDDGSVAIGSRRLGKGMVIQVGVKFEGHHLRDRIEMEIGQQGPKLLRSLYSELLASEQVPRAPATNTGGETVFSRHYVSNNGLYDVWVIFNENRTEATADLTFGKGFNPDAAIEVSTGAAVKTVALANGTGLAGIQLEPMQSRAYLTPRGKIESASRDWFALQRNWWRGTQPPLMEKLPTPESMQKCTLDLTQDWAFSPVESGTQASALAAADFDDSKWKRMRMGIWNIPDYPDVRHAIFRKKFHVPGDWNDGAIKFWLQNWDWGTFRDSADIYLDGSLIEAGNTEGVRAKPMPELRAGTNHVLAVDIQGTEQLDGATGECWLSYLPKPVATEDLGGSWAVTKDALRYDVTTTLPGAWDGWLAKRTVKLDGRYAGKNVLVHYKGNAGITGVIINGRWIRQDHHPICDEWLINVTPWVRFGADNEIEMARMSGPGTGKVDGLSLDFYDRGSYP